MGQSFIQISCLWDNGTFKWKMRPIVHLNGLQTPSDKCPEQILYMSVGSTHLSIHSGDPDDSICDRSTFTFSPRFHIPLPVQHILTAVRLLHLAGKKTVFSHTRNWTFFRNHCWSSAVWSHYLMADYKCLMGARRVLNDIGRTGIIHQCQRYHV